MGAYLFFKLARKTQADKFNKFIAETEEGKRLIKAERPLFVYDKSELEYVKKQNPNWARYYEERLGRGDYKVSGISVRDINDAGCQTLDEYFELITALLVKAQKNFKMWFVSGSCAFNLDGTYFSIDQMKRITQNGKRLKKSSSDPEKYQKLMELLK